MIGNHNYLKSLSRFAGAVALLTALLLLASCGDGAASAVPSTPPSPAGDAASASTGMQMPDGGHGSLVTFGLKTAFRGGGMAFIGVGGSIDGVVNPDLHVRPGDMVKLTLTDGDGAEHDIVFPDFNGHSEHLMGPGSQATVEFTAIKTGQFPYYCTVAGHRQAGMEGKIIVADAAASTGAGPATPSAGEAGATGAPSISRAPDDLPPPVGARPAQTVHVSLEAEEVEGRLADGATYKFWTFNGKVPGPFIRVRVGDTVEVTLKNRADSHMAHSIDLHAVTGPGGGAVVMQVPPGQEKSFTFKALNPGLYVYHCATPMVAQHIANGMYGMILVEPEGGLPKVDREFYVMQGEIYTEQPFGAKGLQQPSDQKLLDERPEYFVFNGSVGALTTEHPLTAHVGETVRIYFGVGGPNFTSSFHVIGEIFDRVFDQGSLTSAPLTNVQTTLVPAGGATVVEFALQTPGKYVLVDHALSRTERGLMGYLLVDGPQNPDVYKEGD